MSINNCCVPCEKADLEDDRWMAIHKRFLQDCLEKDPESKKKFNCKIIKNKIFTNFFLLTF